MRFELVRNPMLSQCPHIFIVARILTEVTDSHGSIVKGFLQRKDRRYLLIPASDAEIVIICGGSQQS